MVVCTKQELGFAVMNLLGDGDVGVSSTPLLFLLLPAVFLNAKLTNCSANAHEISL